MAAKDARSVGGEELGILNGPTKLKASRTVAVVVMLWQTISRKCDEAAAAAATQLPWRREVLARASATE